MIVIFFLMGQSTENLNSLIYFCFIQQNSENEFSQRVDHDCVRLCVPDECASPHLRCYCTARVWNYKFHTDILMALVI